jgi:RNA polymerase sigma-70 factor (ECF subfamily)
MLQPIGERLKSKRPRFRQFNLASAMTKLPPMSVTNQTLLERIRDTSDNQAWGEFFAVYEPLLTGYVRRYGADRGMGFGDYDVREIVQDIFIKLYRSMPTFRLDHARGRFRTWLWRITVNAILDRVPSRKAFRRAQAEPGDASAAPRPKLYDEGQVDLRNVARPDADEDDQWQRDYRQAILARVLAEVRIEIEPTNPNKWASFERHALQGRAAADVAAELGINANLVYQNTARVLQAVRKRCLEEYEEDLANESSLS